MEFISVISALFLFIFLIAAIIGLIKPSIVKCKTRLRAFCLYLAAAFFMFVIGVFSSGKVENLPNEQIQEEVTIQDTKNQDHKKQIDESEPVVKIVEPSPDQIKELEQKFGEALCIHIEQIVKKFKECEPDNYQMFAQYKVREWLPALNMDIDLLNKNRDKYGLTRLKSEFTQINKIYVALCDLNIASISMQSYLRYHKIDNLDFVKNKISEIYEIANQYKK